MAVVDVNGDRDRILVHQTPLQPLLVLGQVITRRAIASYCCNRSWNKLPLNKALKDGPTLDENVLLEDGKVGVNISPPDFRLAGTRSIGSQGVVDKAGLGDIGVVEQGRGKLAIKGFISANEALGGRIVNKPCRNVRQVFVPFSFSQKRKEMSEERCTICVGQSWF